MIIFIFWNIFAWRITNFIIIFFEITCFINILWIIFKTYIVIYFIIFSRFTWFNTKLFWLYRWVRVFFSNIAFSWLKIWWILWYITSRTFFIINKFFITFIWAYTNTHIIINIRTFGTFNYTFIFLMLRRRVFHINIIIKIYIWTWL